MKVKYTPGEMGLVGTSHQVEIVAIELLESAHIKHPMLSRVKIKWITGKTEWISGMQLVSGTNQIEKNLIKRVA